MRRPLLAGAVLALASAVGWAALAGIPPNGPPATAGSRAPSEGAAIPSGASPSGSGAASSPPSASPSPSPAPTPTIRPTPGPWPTLTPRLGAQLQAALDRLRAELQIPGISVSIVFPDGGRWTGVSGVADIASKRPVTAGTAFSIASASKTFLAALILDLAAEGRLDLDDRAADQLPPLAGFGPLDPRITVRMLLNHTSGLHDYFLDPRIDRALQGAPARAWTAADSLAYVGKAWFEPGTSWRYSNTNYLLLGLLAEHLTGRPLAEELRARYLGPLHLGSVTYQGVETGRAPLATGYRLTGTATGLRAIPLSDGSGIVPFRSVVTAAAGAGSLAASSDDLARWAWSLYRGDVLDPPSLDLMLRDVDLVAAYRPRVPYGLGVQAVLVDRFLTYGHSGRFLGFRGAMRYLPAEDLAIAVLTNQNRHDPGLVLAELVRITMAVPPSCPGCPVPA